MGEAPVSTDEVELMLTDYVSLSNSVNRAITLNGDGRKKDVLLTGAGGFFGVQLLSDLLERSTATVHCLMRDGNEDEAYERIAKRLIQYDLPRTKLLRDRVRIVSGDLARENWGLPTAMIEQLKHSVGTVLHNAAEVESGQELCRSSPRKCSSHKIPARILQFGVITFRYIIHSTVSIFSDELFAHYDIVPDKDLI